MLDIDHFKRVNDRQGPDRRRGAPRPRRRDRPPDPPEDLLARYGGEELCIARGLDRAKAEVLAERIRREIEALPIPGPTGAVRVTVSVGVATLGAQDGAQLVAAADEALYRAKEAGRNRVAVFGAGP